MPKTVLSNEKRGNLPNIGETMICPVCGREFKINDSHKFLIREGLVCGWKCFAERGKQNADKKAVK